MSIITRVRNLAQNVAREQMSRLSPKSPVYVFHHIPKCGGRSVNQVLERWFDTIMDYRTGTLMNYPEKVDLNRLRSCHCLCGHFELDGYYLSQRYPDVLNSDLYRVFTFLRDPLAVQLSLFRYEKMKNRPMATTIEEHLALRPNYIAERFPVTLDNYREVIDSYFFVGILEEIEAGMAILASKIGKPYDSFPWLNKSTDAGSSKSKSIELPQELIARFRDENRLDYLIYDYCVEKFKKAAAEHGNALKS